MIRRLTDEQLAWLIQELERAIRLVEREWSASFPAAWWASWTDEQRAGPAGAGIEIVHRLDHLEALLAACRELAELRAAVVAVVAELPL